MKLLRKCGVLILHKKVKNKRSGGFYNYWIACENGTFNLNVCNGYKQTTHKNFKNLREAVEYFEKFIA